MTESVCCSGQTPGTFRVAVLRRLLAYSRLRSFGAGGSGLFRVSLLVQGHAWRRAAPVFAPLAARLRQAAHDRSVVKSEKQVTTEWLPQNPARPSRFAVGFAEPCAAGRT
ncbi:MAG TPA: hypothetical protein VGE93_23685 [Bryobacteraceae bacterium]